MKSKYNYVDSSIIMITFVFLLQLRVDRYADLFAIGGLGLAVALKSSYWTGLIAGMNAGIIAAAVQNAQDKQASSS